MLESDFFFPTTGAPYLFFLLCGCHAEPDQALVPSNAGIKNSLGNNNCKIKYSLSIVLVVLNTTIIKKKIMIIICYLLFIIFIFLF
jgi:hypothetical protein